MIRAVASMRAFLNLIYLLSILTPSFCFRARPQSTAKSVERSLLSLEKKSQQMKLQKKNMQMKLEKKNKQMKLEKKNKQIKLEKKNKQMKLKKKNTQMKLIGFIKRTAFRANTISINASVNCVRS